MTEEIIKIAQRAEERCKERFQEIDQVAQKNTERDGESDIGKVEKVKQVIFCQPQRHGYSFKDSKKQKRY